MEDDQSNQTEVPETGQKTKKRSAKSDKGEIPSGLSYVNATGVLGKILSKIIDAPAPDRFTQDFLSECLGV